MRQEDREGARSVLSYAHPLDDTTPSGIPSRTVRYFCYSNDDEHGDRPCKGELAPIPWVGFSSEAPPPLGDSEAVVAATLPHPIALLPHLAVSCPTTRGSSKALRHHSGSVS